MILNIRGANGAGKTTLARGFIPPNTKTVELAHYMAKKDKAKTVIGYHDDRNDVIVCGSYRTGCGGMDTMPNFEVARQAIEKAAFSASHVIAEGVLASTVYESWHLFARALQERGKVFAFVYLHTPLDECLRRIYARNGGKPIKEDQVKAKVKAVMRTREKAIKDKHAVYDLPADDPLPAAVKIMRGLGGEYLATRN